MELLSWYAAAFVLALPSGYQLESQTVQTVQSAMGGSAVETMCLWKNRQGQTVTFFWWSPYPPHAGGPMVAAREAKGLWAGAEASFVETKVFQGSNARLAVAFQQRPDLQAVTRIAATGLELAELQALLKAATLRALTADAASKVGCAAIPPQGGESAI